MIITRIVVVALLAICNLQSCKKSDEKNVPVPVVPPTKDLGSGTVLMDLNGVKPWSSTISTARYNSNGRFSFAGYIMEDSIETQSFNIENAPLEGFEKMFSIRSYSQSKERDKMAWAGFYLEDGDAIECPYDLYEKESSSVTITFYDAATNHIKGNFSLSLVPPSGVKPTRGFPDTLRIANGQFDLYIGPK